MRRMRETRAQAAGSLVCSSLSDLQGPQRQRSVHPDNQFPAEQKRKDQGVGERRK